MRCLHTVICFRETSFENLMKVFSTAGLTEVVGAVSHRTEVEAAMAPFIWLKTSIPLT